MISNYRALIFDMDGTLVDSMFYWRNQNVEFLKRHGIVLPDIFRGREVEMTSRKMYEWLQQNGYNEITYEQIMREAEEHMTTRYEAGLPAKPGALAFLERAHKLGYRMCIATVTPRKSALLSLDKQGITKYFEFIIAGGDTAVQKREAGYYKAIAERFHVEPEECLVFEDALYAMKSAARAGMDVVAIKDHTSCMDEPEIRKIADCYITDYHSIMEAL